MGKQFLTTISICGISMVLMGMGRVGPVNIDRTNDPQFATFVGNEYQTLEDMVIYRFTDSTAPSLSPYGDGYIPKKEEMKDKFPFKYEDKKIMGVLPRGTVFKIKQVREEGPPSGTFIVPYGEVVQSKDGAFLGQKFDVSNLTKILSNPLEFKSNLVNKRID